MSCAMEAMERGARTYTVEGRWPFPLDMLRRDQAQAATPADQVLIDRMSDDISDPEFGTRKRVQITLIMQFGAPTHPKGSWEIPNIKHWQSFGWIVLGSDAEEVRPVKIAEQDAFHPSRFAKLTDEKRLALFDLLLDVAVSAEEYADLRSDDGDEHTALREAINAFHARAARLRFE